MDQNDFVMYVHELNNQCVFAEGSLQLLNQAMEKEIKFGTFLALQNMMLAVSQVSRILWPTAKKTKEDAQELRKALGLKDDHPINDKSLRDMWQNTDTKTRDWMTRSKGKNIVIDFIGRRDEVPHGERVEDDYIYRMFDPETKVYYYRGEAFELERLVKDFGEIAMRVRAAHDKVFPKSEDRPDQGDEKERAEKDEKGDQPASADTTKSGGGASSDK